MSSTVFKDTVFPSHVSDLMTVMHMMVFDGTDGDERWETYLSQAQKECVALGLALYYQCEHCIDYHTKVLVKKAGVDQSTLWANINSLILFLRTEVDRIGESEKQRWIQAWHEYSAKVSHRNGDQMRPYLIGLAIGMARDDRFLIEFCGRAVKKRFEELGVDPRQAIGELEAVVIFMKAAASKNRIVPKIESIFAEEAAAE